MKASISACATEQFCATTWLTPTLTRRPSASKIAAPNGPPDSRSTLRAESRIASAIFAPSSAHTSAGSTSSCTHGGRPSWTWARSMARAYRGRVVAGACGVAEAEPRCGHPHEPARMTGTRDLDPPPAKPPGGAEPPGLAEDEGATRAPPPAPGGDMPLASPVDPGDDSPFSMKGRTLGPYRISAQIGSGGMGAVYLADQTAPVRRQVALKVIKAGIRQRGAAVALPRRARAAGADVPSQHRPGAGRGRDRRGAALFRDGVRARRAAGRVLRPPRHRPARTGVELFLQVLRRRAARAPEGRDPSRPQARQPAGRRLPGPGAGQGDRLRDRQEPRSARAPGTRHHARRHAAGHAGLHEPRAGRRRPRRDRYPHRRLRAGRGALQAGHARTADPGRSDLAHARRRAARSCSTSTRSSRRAGASPS